MGRFSANATKIPENEQIGEFIPGKGVYLGPWNPEDSNGKLLLPSRTLLVFVAREDLVDSDGNKIVMTFKRAAEEVGGLKNWHGHDGIDLKYENYRTSLDYAIKSGSVFGRWFIPPLELLNGMDNYLLHDDKVRTANMYDLKNVGDFKDSFTTVPHRLVEISDSGLLMVTTGGPLVNAHSYWACTKAGDAGSENLSEDLQAIMREMVYSVDFSNGNPGIGHPDHYDLACRPCMVMPVAHFAL